mgnify:CR=1 FL=1
MWNVDVELVGSGPIVDVRDVGEFVDIIVCPVIGHAVAVSCAAVDAHLQDEVVNVLGKTFQVFLDRRPEVVTFSWTSWPGGDPPYGEVQQGAA